MRRDAVRGNDVYAALGFRDGVTVQKHVSVIACCIHTYLGAAVVFIDKILFVDIVVGVLVPGVHIIIYEI
ncbi:hypothetical protein LY78DRAFT_658141 [Colletotrichum sublineola]|nr:hypothetical protein LY78DRAFT_658141 [Colletotrichum sublineola]